MEQTIESNMGSAEKRFTLSKESFAQERMGAIKDTVKIMRQEHPEVLSLCLYGSMVKGTAKEQSDIDGYLFIDADKIENFDKKDDLENEISEESLSATTYLKENLENKYRLPIQESLKNELALSDEQVEHIRVRPISPEIIDAHISNLEDGFIRTEEYEKEFKKWEAANPEGKGASVDDLIDYYSRRPKVPLTPNASDNLAGMFNLDVGGGINKYRKYLIEKLSSAGETGEKIWREIIGRTEEMEQSFSRDTSKSYPRTLERANEVYGK